MAETVNYGLYITDDPKEKFIEWRRKLDGLDESNMIIIDRLLGEKSTKSYCLSGVLLASAWVGDGAPYIQNLSGTALHIMVMIADDADDGVLAHDTGEVIVDDQKDETSGVGITAGDNGVISLAQSSTIDERNEARRAALAVIGQRDGELTIAADGARPSMDIPVEILIVG